MITYKKQLDTGIKLSIYENILIATLIFIRPVHQQYQFRIKSDKA
jgi:hypothetical protein